jgi:hypothetical protein
MWRTLTATLLAVACAGGCGAKTGLLVPDVISPPDVADVIDAPDVPDVPDVPRRCVSGNFDLVGRESEVLLVLDRSGSMNQRLGGMSRWQLLRNALAATLPRFEDRINVGALFFPEDGAASRTAACAIANVPSVDVIPSFRATPRVLSVLDNSGTGGGTPTAAALQRAYTYFVRNPSRLRARYLLLATDGAPNCNPDLDGSTCRCTGGGSCRTSDPTRCLDDVRTVDIVRQIANNPVAPMATYVIGIANDDETVFASTLTAMAVAGGRPKRLADGRATYYDVREPDDLATALNAVQNAVARCTFLAPSRPREGTTITILVNGVAAVRDETRANGWDWTDRALGEITLFGPACPADASLSTRVSARVACVDE